MINWITRQIRTVFNKPPGKAVLTVLTAAVLSPFAFLAATNEAGISYTEQFEGTVLHNYLDSVGVETWCTGETQVGRLESGYTKEYCSQLFFASYAQYSSQLYGCYTDEMKKYVTPSMHAAFVDVYYNTGAKCNTGMMRALKRGDPVGACNFILKYKRAGGRDCSVRANNCYGVWARRLVAHEQLCLPEAYKLQEQLQ